MITEQQQAAENEAEIRRLIARAEAAAGTGDYQAEAENQAEIKRLEARAAAAAAQTRDYQTTDTGKISGIHIALLAAAAFYLLG